MNVRSGSGRMATQLGRIFVTHPVAAGRPRGLRLLPFSRSRWAWENTAALYRQGARRIVGWRYMRPRWIPWSHWGTSEVTDDWFTPRRLLRLPHAAQESGICSGGCYHPGPRHWGECCDLQRGQCGSVASAALERRQSAGGNSPQRPQSCRAWQFCGLAEAKPCFLKHGGGGIMEPQPHFN